MTPLMHSGKGPFPISKEIIANLLLIFFVPTSCSAWLKGKMQTKEWITNADKVKADDKSEDLHLDFGT